MMSSDPSRWLAAILLIYTGQTVRADELKLAGDTHLTGNVRSIDDTGGVVLESRLSPGPVKVRGPAISKVDFSNGAALPAAPGGLVELANGDLLPVRVEGLDDATLSVSTPSAGKLSISRTVLNSLQMGVRTRRLVYTGPVRAEEWSDNSPGIGQWSYSGGALTANGPAYGSQVFKLPRQFILKFKLRWRSSPSVLVYFADPLKNQEGAVDRYILQFNTAGLEIRRESSAGKRFHTVILLPRTPDQFPNKQVEMEIRVDRKGSRLHLLLDGEQEAAGIDPSTVECTGNGVQLVNSSPPGGAQEIRNIEIQEYDNTRARHRAEDRGNTAKDSLISRDDDRWSGQLTGIRRAGDDVTFAFKSNFQEEGLELEENDISTIFFAKAPGVEADVAPSGYLVRMRGEGFLHADACVLSGNTVTVRHRLLGDLSIGKDGIASIEKVVKNAPEAVVEPEPEEEPE